MKSTGIIRKVDELGRIVLPIEIRRTLDIAERDEIEIFMESDQIILQKFEQQNFKKFSSSILHLFSRNASFTCDFRQHQYKKMDKR